jgi:hypothetical protein
LLASLFNRNQRAIALRATRDGISSPQRRASETSARPPRLPDCPRAPIARRRARRSAGTALDARIRRRSRPADPTLPEQIGALAHDLVQTCLGLRQYAMRISVWGQLATAADMHLGIQTLEFLVRDQLGVARRLQSLLPEGLILHGGRGDRDRKCVQNLGTLLFRRRLSVPA